MGNLSVGQSYGVVDFPDHFRSSAGRLSDQTEVLGDGVDAIGDRQTVLDHGQHIHDDEQLSLDVRQQCIRSAVRYYSN